jgi:hypothetical protein
MGWQAGLHLGLTLIALGAAIYTRACLRKMRRRRSWATRPALAPRHPLGPRARLALRADVERVVWSVGQVIDGLDLIAKILLRMAPGERRRPADLDPGKRPSTSGEKPS